MLTLRIENLDRLPDGGPLFIQVDKRGLDFGRDQHLDWTLPDPSRFISGKHCEVRFFDGAYWLYDVSTNGTFVNNNSKRVQSPYKLVNGDQLNIGEYVISVAVKSPVTEAPARIAQPAAATEHPPVDDLWRPTGEAPPPINPRDLQPPSKRNYASADFLHEVSGPMPVPRPFGEAAPKAYPEAPVHDPWGPTGIERPSSPAPAADWAGVADMAFPAVPSPRRRAVETANEPPLLPQAGISPDIARTQAEREFIRKFAQGANISEDVLAHLNAGDMARELGMFVNLVCGNLMQLLSARAAAKTLARSGHRTMIQPTENNPLKFMPTAEDAIKAMFGPGSSSYLDSRRTIENSFADLKTHQVAALAAMQSAAAQLFEELDPEAVEQASGAPKKSLLGNSKSKFWDAYTERWKTKAASHEHGLLGAFLELYAEYYDRQTRNKR